MSEEKPNWKEITIYNKKNKEILAVITLNVKINLKDIGVDIERRKT